MKDAKLSKKESAKEGEIRTFGGREYIKKDGKWKYRPRGASKTEESKKDLSAQDHRKEAEVWAKELSGKTRTDRSKGMTMSQIDEKEAYHSRMADLKEAKPASGKYIGDMSATEKEALADKLGIDVKGKTTKQVDKAITDAMVDKQLADFKASKKSSDREHQDGDMYEVDREGGEKSTSSLIDKAIENIARKYDKEKSLDDIFEFGKI